MFKSDKTIQTYAQAMSEFKGLNRLPVVNEGELRSCVNLIFDNYPVMSVRRGRTKVSQLPGVPQAWLAIGDKFAVIIDNTLYFGVESTGLTLSSGEKSMVEFWGKIFVFPDAKYYDIATGSKGSIGSGSYPDDKGSVPEIDYAVVHNNRIWGCKGNHIYCSYQGNAMGKFTVTINGKPEERYGWTYFVDDDGNPAEVGSFAVDCAIDGDLKGICSWDNRIVCLGENEHVEVYGDYPSNFSLRSVTKYGTIGNRTIQEVNSRLYYVSRHGVLQYSGGVEKEISRNLNETFSSAVAGTDGIRYYLCLNDGANKRLYVYHTALGCWTQEDNPGIVAFAQQKGCLYALCKDGWIYRFNDPDSDERVHWQFSFDDYSTSVYNNTVVRSLTLKVKCHDNAYMDIKVKTDCREEETRKSITFPNAALQRVNVGCRRGGEHLFTVTGEGKAEIWGYQYTFTDGGEK